MIAEMKMSHREHENDMQEEDIDDNFKFALPSENVDCTPHSANKMDTTNSTIMAQNKTSDHAASAFISSLRNRNASKFYEIASTALSPAGEATNLGRKSRTLTPQTQPIHDRAATLLSLRRISSKDLPVSVSPSVESTGFGQKSVPLTPQTEPIKRTTAAFLSSRRRLMAANSSEIDPALFSKELTMFDSYADRTKTSNRPVPQPAPNKIISSPVNRNTYVGSKIPEAEWTNSSVSGKNIPEEFVCMQFAVIAIDRVGKLGRVKPYLVLKRQHGYIFEEIARSETKAPGSVDYSFEMFVLAAPVVCFNDYQRPIRIELWHSDSDGNDILISQIQTCVGDLDLLGKTANPAQRCITFERSSDSKYKKENASISRFNGIEYSVPKTAAGLCVLQQIIIRYRTSMGVLLSNGRIFDHDADDVIKLELSVENLSKRKALRFELFAMHDVPDNMDAVANVLMSTNARLSSTRNKQEKSKKSTLNTDNEDMRCWRIAYASETSKPSCVLKFNGFVRRAHSLCQEDYDLPVLIKLIDGEQLFGKVCLTMRQILLSCSLESVSGNPMDFPIADETGHNKGSIRFKTADVYSTAADIETAAELSLRRLGISFDGSRLQMLEHYLEWLTKRDTIRRRSESRDKRSFTINSLRRLSRRTSSCNTNESIAMQNLDKTADDDKNQDEISALSSIRDQNIEEYFADRAMPSYVALTLRADNLKVPFLAKLSGVKPVLSISRLIDGVWCQVYTASANVQEDSSYVFPRVVLKLKKLASNVEDSDNILDDNILVQVLNAKSKSSDIIGQERLTIRKLVALRGGYRVSLMSHKYPEKQTGSLVAISVKHKLRKRNTSNSTVQ